MEYGLVGSSYMFVFVSMVKVIFGRAVNLCEKLQQSIDKRIRFNAAPPPMGYPDPGCG